MDSKYSLLLSLQQTALQERENELYSEQKYTNTAGVPKECMYGEKRVAIVPAAVQMLTDEGNKVLVEKDAGLAAGFPDMEYIEAGAEIVNTNEAWATNIVLTVSHPDINHIRKMSTGGILITSIVNGSVSSATLNALVNKKITAIGRELINHKEGHSPVRDGILAIDGKEAVLMAAEKLNNANGGKGILFGGVAGITQIEMVVFGGCTVTEYIVQVALALGSTIKVFAPSTYMLSRMKQKFGQSLPTFLMFPAEIEKALRTADVLIASIDCKYCNPTFKLTEDMLKVMKPGSVIIDMIMPVEDCCGEETMDKRFFEKYGIQYYAVNNISSRVAHTASMALSNVLTSITMDLCASSNVESFLRQSKALSEGTYVYKGMISNEVMGNINNTFTQDINMLLI
jgi:alanine dehydrogenase